MNVDSIASILASFDGQNLFLAAIAVLIAGIVRGFSGFGAAMIIVPVLGLLYDPQTAVAALSTMEMTAQIQFLRISLKDADWKQAAPMSMAGIVALPLGTWVLVTADPDLLRTITSALVLLLVLLLASGYRHNTRRRTGLDCAVGSFSGFLNGAVGLGGPPVIFYLLAGPNSPKVVRASITAFFQIAMVVLVGIQIWFEVLTFERMLLGLALAPGYLIGIYIGGKLFYMASEQTFRRIALTLLAIVGVGTLVA